MSEPEPEMTFYTNQGDFIITPQNASLYMFVEDKYDHVFFNRAEPIIGINGLQQAMGNYVLKIEQPEVFVPAAIYMMDNQYPASLNQRFVPECDKIAFNAAIERMAKAAMTDELEMPDDWR